MNILAMDTSTKQYSLAVAVKGALKAYKNVKADKVLSDTIMVNIDKVLSKAGVALAGLDGFAVGLGPGSFTSLRVGLSTVKALAFATKKPVVGVSSLDALAMAVKDKDAAVCTVMDARRGLVYACHYRKKNNVLERDADYQLVDIGKYLKGLKAPGIFVGDALDLYRDSILQSKKCLRLEDGESAFPQARYLLPLALERFRKGQFDDAARLVPIYLYPEDCQVTKSVK